MNILAISNISNFDFKAQKQNPKINTSNPIVSNETTNKKSSLAFKSYFLAGQSVNFGGTSNFKIKKLEDVPCPCCGQVMLTPESTERHINRLKLAKGDKLADRIINEEQSVLRSNERTAALIIADKAKGTSLNLSGATKKAQENLPENFNSYCQNVLMEAAIIAEENLGENSTVSQFFLSKADNLTNYNEFYRPNLTEEFSQFKSSLTEEQYNQLEDKLLTLPLDYKNVSRIFEETADKAPLYIAQRLYAPSLATAEHVHPHSLGGGNDASNFLSECAGCNNPRSSMSYVEWFKVHPEFKRNAQGYIEHVEKRIVNGELPQTYDSYPTNIRETLTSESEGHIVLKVLDKTKLQELRQAQKSGQNVDIHAETNKEESDDNQNEI